MMKNIAQNIATVDSIVSGMATVVDGDVGRPRVPSC